MIINRLLFINMRVNHTKELHLRSNLQFSDGFKHSEEFFIVVMMGHSAIALTRRNEAVMDLEK